MRRLALKRTEPRSARRRIIEGVFGIVMGGLALFAVVDQWFGFRERAAAMAGYAAAHQRKEPATEAIQSRIAASSGLETLRVGSVAIQQRGSSMPPCSTGG